MSSLELFITAIALSMDAFAVSVCFGLSMKRVSVKKALIVGLYFGGFQAGMPLIGYLAASRFADMIMRLDHWIAFALLGFIGAKMVMESTKQDDGAPYETEEASLSPSKMLPLAVATSIDAMAAGILFAFLHVNIVPAVSFIGVATLALSMAGVKTGNIFGAKLKSKAELAGGVILILMGFNILFQHTGII